MLALGEPWRRGDDTLVGIGIQPSRPPGKGAVGDRDMVAERHEPDLVMCVPRLHAADEFMGARRNEFTRHRFDVV